MVESSRGKRTRIKQVADGIDSGFSPPHLSPPALSLQDYHRRWIRTSSCSMWDTAAQWSPFASGGHPLPIPTAQSGASTFFSFHFCLTASASVWIQAADILMIPACTALSFWRFVSGRDFYFPLCSVEAIACEQLQHQAFCTIKKFISFRFVLLSSAGVLYLKPSIDIPKTFTLKTYGKNLARNHPKDCSSVCRYERL